VFYENICKPWSDGSLVAPSFLRNSRSEVREKRLTWAIGSLPGAPRHSEAATNAERIRGRTRSMRNARCCSHGRACPPRQVSPCGIFSGPRNPRKDAKIFRAADGCGSHADVATALCRRAGGNAPSASTQRGGYKRRGLVKGNSNDFALIRPSLRRLAQSCSYRIHSHIIPFLRVAFMAAQQMVEKTFLPVRLGNSKL